MGLEVFDFIPDLVDTNPVGATDFVNEGDDHLRGLKFTLQRQFPNIGQNEMTRTALELNDAPLLSAANLFTDKNTFQDTNLEIAATTNAQNAYLQLVDESGFTRWATGRASSIGGGLGRYAINRHDAAGVTIDTALAIDPTNSQLQALNGSAAVPGWSFQSSPNMGMYRIDSGILGFAPSGTEQIRLTNAFAQFSGVLRAPQSADAALPAYAFAGETSTGMFRAGSGQLGFSIFGTEFFRISGTAINVLGSTQGIRNVSGSAAQPSYTFTNSTGLGLSFLATNIMGFSAGGVERGRLTETGWEFKVVSTHVNEGTVTRTINTQARTGWRLTNLANQPMWSIYMGADPNNTLSFQRYNAAGAFQDIPLSIRQLNGLIRMSTLPTSDAGLIAGELWRNPVSPGFIAIV